MVLIVVVGIAESYCVAVHQRRLLHTFMFWTSNRTLLYFHLWAEINFMLLTAKEFALSQKQRRYRKGAVYWNVSAPFFHTAFRLVTFSHPHNPSCVSQRTRIPSLATPRDCHSDHAAKQKEAVGKKSNRRRSQHTFILLAWHRSNVWKTPYRDLKTVFSKISTVAFQTGDTGSPRGIAFHCTGKTTFHLWNSWSLLRIWIG